MGHMIFIVKCNLVILCMKEEELPHTLIKIYIDTPCLYALTPYMSMGGCEIWGEVGVPHPTGPNSFVLT